MLIYIHRIRWNIKSAKKNLFISSKDINSQTNKMAETASFICIKHTSNGLQLCLLASINDLQFWNFEAEEMVHPRKKDLKCDKGICIIPSKFQSSPPPTPWFRGWREEANSLGEFLHNRQNYPRKTLVYRLYTYVNVFFPLCFLGKELSCLRCGETV